MAIASTTMKNSLAQAYANAATHAALYTSAPTSSAGTEVSGGSPAYARKPITWSAPSNGVVTAQVVFDVPSGATIRGIGVHSALTGGNYLDGVTVSDQAFTSQGTYTVSLSFTLS